MAKDECPQGRNDVVGQGGVIESIHCGRGIISKDNFGANSRLRVAILLLASGVVFGALGVLGISGTVAQAEAKQAVLVSKPVNSLSIQEVRQYAVEAGRDMARGDFEKARRLLAKCSVRVIRGDDSKGRDGGGDSHNADKGRGVFAEVARLRELLVQYDKLQAENDKARQDAYNEYMHKMRRDVHRARQAEETLQAVLNYDPNSPEKSSFERELRKEIQKNWLDSLARLSTAHYMIKQFGLKGKSEPAQRDEIIARCQKIADRIVKRDNGLDAYNKVYSYLSLLDKHKYQYDDLFWKLKREVLMRAVYVPDPNQGGISWEERRKGVSLDIASLAFAIAQADYVLVPNFPKMAKRGLLSCLLLAETSKLDKAFSQLDDKGKVKSYISGIKKLMVEAANIKKADYDYIKLLKVLLGAMQVNKQTLQLPDKVIISEFTDAAFTALDPFSYVIWPANVAEFRKEMTNEFYGIGVAIRKPKGKLTVDSLISYDSPAYKAGLDVGDVITAVNGVKTDNLTLEKCVRLITGPLGTQVELTIKRKGKKPFNVKVVRARISVDPVEGFCRDNSGRWKYFLDRENGVAYIRLVSFTGHDVAGVFRSKLEELKDRGMKSLILDLRNNGGGYLSSAVSIVDDFVNSGVIVSARYRVAKPEIKKATVSGTFDSKMPLIVLINSNSASASEIVSGSLKDHHRALLIGTRSYGKGSVQTIIPLQSTKAQMKLTIAYYYLPSGRCVNRDPQDKFNEDYGVSPNIKMELTGKQLLEYIKTNRDAAVMRRNDAGQVSQSGAQHKIFNARAILKSDPQMRLAYLCMEAGRVAQQLAIKN